MKTGTASFANNQQLIISEKSVAHLERHREITNELVVTAATKITPDLTKKKQGLLVDLQDEFGMWGKSGKISSDPIGFDDKVLFGRRAGAPNLSRISLEDPMPASILQIWIFKNSNEEWELTTAYPTDGAQGEREPINKYSQFDSGYLRKCLDYWSKNELAFETSNVEGGMEGLYKYSWRDILSYHHRLYGGFQL